MTFKKGDPKPERAGRRAGVPNKRSNKVLELLEQEGYDPLLEAVKLLKMPAMTKADMLNLYSEYENACYESGTEPEDARAFLAKLEENQLTAKDKLDGHIKLIKYVYPSRKAIEVSATDEKNPPSFTITLTPPKGD